MASGCPGFHRGPLPNPPAGATFVSADDVNVRYSDQGQGPAVVLLHGYSSSLDIWKQVAPVLAKRHRVIAVDLKGFGFTERPPGDYSLAAQSKLVWSVLDKLGVKDAAIVGHSWGASVALAMTLSHPTRVRRVALYSAYVFENQVPSFLRWARIGGVGEALFSLFYRERLADRVALAYYDSRFVTAERIDHVQREFGRPGAVAAALATARGQRYAQIEARYASIEQPILLLWGKNDRVTPITFAHRLRNELRDAELVELDRCGHIPMVEAFAATTRALDRFPRRGRAMRIALTMVLTATFALGSASGDGLVELGSELAPRRFASPRQGTDVELDGSLRLRGEALRNFDLDRGLTPSGAPLFPVPLADPSGQTLTGADTRLRSDMSIFAPGSGVAVKLRIDVLDNLALGSTPEGKPTSGRAPTPAASPGQKSPSEALLVKRAYGEVLLPFGLLAAGRMGAHWGLGMVANGGDCEDCDGGDASDRIAFLTPIAGLVWAAAFDISATGPVQRRKGEVRPIDIEPTDDVRTVTFAAFRAESELVRQRWREAGRSLIEYGLLLSYRWQKNDVPADYLPTAQPIPIDAAQVVSRGYSASAADAWLRLSIANLRIEVEAAYLRARIDEPSLVPGVLLGVPVTSDQFGFALEADYRLAAVELGFDLGFASGDDAPGFGAFVPANAAAPLPGDLDGAQANLPNDRTVNNFRFNSDYHIDRILFREIIGTVTDAVYLRPSGRYRILNVGPAHLDFELAIIASWAIKENSTPSGSRALGIEVDPGFVYRSGDGFRAALEAALFVPGSGFDNPAEDLGARSAQSVRLRLGYHF